MEKSVSKKIDKYIPDFDSSSALLISLGNYLADNPKPSSWVPKLPLKVGDMVNRIPKSILLFLFTLRGANESLSVEKAAKLDDRGICDWIVRAYPEKKYPAVMIGSANGALIHLCAMLGIPWIPQTILLPPTRKMAADDLIGDIEWGKKAVLAMKKNLPYFRLHQMHDPIQDRRLVTHMGFFRAKRLELGPYLEAFLKKTLMPGATIFIADCGYRWPSHKISSHHYFQVGGLGDVDAYEYLNGSPRIEQFLQTEGSNLKRWTVPEGHEDIPEAEWGFVGELAESIGYFSNKYGHRRVHIKFDHPDDASPFCADATKWWYEKNGIYDSRLLIECFALLAPWWAARTGSIPFWIPFNTHSSLRMTKNFLQNREKYNEMYAMLMPNAVDGIGLASIKDWKDVMGQHSIKSTLIGTDEKKYPYDIGMFIKYYKDMRTKITARHFMPHYLEIDEFLNYCKKKSGEYNISFNAI